MDGSLFCGMVFLAPLLLLLVCCLGAFIREWIADAWDKTNWLFNDNLFGTEGMHDRGYFGDKTSRAVGQAADAAEKMDSLIKEIVKARYCEEVLDNPPMDKDMMEKRMSVLRKLEGMYPDHVRWYSPTKYNGYSESKAVETYGSKSWERMKRTLSLIGPNSPLDKKEELHCG